MTQLEKQQRQQPQAMAVGAKTARPCDICLHSRARWYCAADDAFLCQSCDSSIHSANALARRHERLRLQVSSSSSNIKNHHVVVDDEDEGGGGKPTWHQGFKRKARTPRGTGKESTKSSCRKTGAVVPQLGTTSSSSSDVEECAGCVEEEEAGQLLYRVPVFNPVLTNFQQATSNAEKKKPDVIFALKKDQSSPLSYQIHGGETVDDLPAFLPTEMGLGEFEIDMESLLGRGLDENPFSMEGLGLMDSPEEGGSSDVEELSPTENYGTVKEEEQEEMYIDNDLAEVKFDCGSPWTGEETTDEDNKVIGVAVVAEGKKAKIKLKLNYDAVITEWSQGSPWTNGQKPMLDSHDSFPDFTGMVYVGGGDEFQGGMTGNNGGNGLATATASGDGGRAARVSRYREKRRTRLFSKKIRYEVRKLNAEKRPRMKGRFVKRTSSATSTTTSNVAARVNAVASPQFVYC